MHTTPETLHGKFKALAQGRGDYIVDVIHTSTPKFGDMLTVCASEEAVYITKEQAMAFFDLVPVSQLTTAIVALEKISRLGNEPYLGNSVGNCIAQDALKLLKETK